MADPELVSDIKRYRRPADWRKLEWGTEGGARLYIQAAEIQRLEVAVRRALLQRARALARQLCPVSIDGSNGNPPGYLRDSIGYNTATGVLRATAPYAAYQEFGTRYQPRGQPFMFPALRQALQEFGRSRRVTPTGTINEP